MKNSTVLTEKELDSILQSGAIPINVRATLYAHDALLRHRAGLAPPPPSLEPVKVIVEKPVERIVERVVEKIVKVETSSADPEAIARAVAAEREWLCQWLIGENEGDTVRAKYGRKLAERIRDMEDAPARLAVEEIRQASK